MRIDRRKLVAISFILLSLGSAVYVTTATLNYLNYYPALGQIQVQISRVSIDPKSNGSRIDSQIVVLNPSDYSGFRLAEADISMYFVNGSGVTLFSPGSVGTVQPIGVSLGPHSTVDANVVIQLGTRDAQSLATFIAASVGGVMAAVQLTVEITSFLVSVLGRLPYSSTAELTVSTG